jgi:hypothetical protein
MGTSDKKYDLYKKKKKMIIIIIRLIIKQCGFNVEIY